MHIISDACICVPEVVMAKDYKCRVFTLNRRFEQIRKKVKNILNVDYYIDM